MKTKNPNATENALSPRVQTLLFVKSLYGLVRAGQTATADLLPKVTNSRLRAEMTVQLGEYERYTVRLLRLLTDLGGVAEEETPFSRFSSHLGLTFGTLTASDAPRLSSLLLRQSAAALTEATSLLRDNENRPVTEESLRTARDLIAAEERRGEVLKTFLVGQTDKTKK